MGSGEERRSREGAARTGYAAAHIRLSGLILAGRQPKMGTDVIRSSELGWIIDCCLELQRGHRSDAGDCHEASAELVIHGQTQQGSMQIGESRLHRLPSGQKRMDAQFDERIAGNQLPSSRLEVSCSNLADLKTKGAQQASALVLVVPQLVDVELARGQQRA